MFEDYETDFAEEVPDKEVTPSKGRKSYTVAFKLEVVDYPKKNRSINSAHKKNRRSKANPTMDG